MKKIFILFLLLLSSCSEEFWRNRESVNQVEETELQKGAKRYILSASYQMYYNSYYKKYSKEYKEFSDEAIKNMADNEAKLHYAAWYQRSRRLELSSEILVNCLRQFGEQEEITDYSEEEVYFCYKEKVITWQQSVIRADEAEYNRNIYIRRDPRELTF